MISFKLSSNLKDNLTSIKQPVLNNVRIILEEKGFKVQLYTKVSGVSGVEHFFDAIVEKDKTKIAIDVSVNGERNDMISLLGKKTDVKIARALIIDLSDSDELRNLGEIYGIEVVKNDDNLEEKLVHNSEETNHLDLSDLKQARFLLKISEND